MDELKTIHLGDVHPIVFDLRDIGPALLFTAIFTHHYDIFQYLMSKLRDLENSGPLKGSVRAREAYEHYVNNFTDAYFNHPELITPEDLLVVKPYITPSRLEIYINQLNERGYKELARLLQ